MENKKLALVVGCSRGIGKSIAKTLLENDYNVIGVSRNDCDFKKDYSNFTMYNLDATNSKDVEKFSECISNMEIDFFIYNSGGNFEHRAITEANPENWISAYRLNVIGLLNFVKIILPKMILKNKGKILVITSVIGHTKSYPGGASYTNTKHAEVSLVESIRDEVRNYNISVTELAPGTTNTESNKNSHAIESKDVAEAVRWVGSLPQSVSIDRLIINPT